MITIIFALTLALLCKRKDFQPLKSTSVVLIWLSTLANCCCFVCIMLNKILSNNKWNFWENIVNAVAPIPSFSKSQATLTGVPSASQYSFWVNLVIESTCFVDYLNWRFFRVIWLVPYLFRILKLYQIWNFHRVYMKTEQEI